MKDGRKKTVDFANMQKKKTTESLEGNGKERKKMPKQLTDTIKDMIVEMYTDGRNMNDIANRLDISYSSVSRTVIERGLKDVNKRESQTIDLSNIEQKLDAIPDRVVRKINEILDIAPNMSEHILSLESIGYKSTDKKTYIKKDGNQSRQVSFINKDQITYSTKDLNGREIERYYFNAETLEAIFGAILDRGWNYFKR